jgi:hypothetical protein
LDCNFYAVLREFQKHRAQLWSTLLRPIRHSARRAHGILWGHLAWSLHALKAVVSTTGLFRHSA